MCAHALIMGNVTVLRINQSHPSSWSKVIIIHLKSMMRFLINFTLGSTALEGFSWHLLGFIQLLEAVRRKELTKQMYQSVERYKITFQLLTVPWNNVKATIKWKNWEPVTLPRTEHA